MLYITSPGLIRLMKFVPFDHLHLSRPPLHSLPLVTTDLISVSMNSVFLDPTYNLNHAVFIFLCLTYFT